MSRILTYCAFLAFAPGLALYELRKQHRYLPPVPSPFVKSPPTRKQNHYELDKM